MMVLFSERAGVVWLFSGGAWLFFERAGVVWLFAGRTVLVVAMLVEDDSVQGVVSGFYIGIKFNFNQGAPSSLCLPK